MKKYKITWTETVDMQDFVEGESEEDALDKFEARPALEHFNAQPLTDMLISEGTLKATLVEENEDL
jgi:hypothetical protein|tara:strand:- start:176 stop:373 length:198 start_codon:yes stop_codon:yes gene_type:complete